MHSTDTDRFAPRLRLGRTPLRVAGPRLLAGLLVPGLFLAATAAPVTRVLSLDDAITLALAHNDTILIEREAVSAAEAATLRARGAYDPALVFQTDYRRATLPINSPFSGAPGDAASPTTRTTEALFALSQLLPTGGSATVRMDASRQTTDSVFVFLTPAYQTRLGVEVRQPLLRGRSIDPARLGLRVAAADRSRSVASLRREVTGIVASVEGAYWSLASSRRDLQVREEAVALAEEQLAQTRARVEEGAAPKTEISQPLAELERRRGDLYSALETLKRDENALKRMILDANDPANWAVGIEPGDDPNIVTDPLDQVDPASALARALSNRPELKEWSAQVERRRIESEFAHESLKPGLDAFVSYDRLGLSGALADQDPNGAFTVVVPDWIEGGLDRSLGTLGEGRFDDTRAGLVLSIPIGNRSARGEAAIAEASRRQTEAGMEGVRRRIMAEVLDAVAALDTASQRVGAGRAAREAAAVQLGAERDRFAAGLSTNFLVLTRQNDLSRARLDEIDALTDYRKARTEMARATGSLLEERHIEVEAD